MNEDINVKDMLFWAYLLDTEGATIRESMTPVLLGRDIRLEKDSKLRTCLHMCTTFVNNKRIQLPFGLGIGGDDWFVSKCVVASNDMEPRLWYPCEETCFVAAGTGLELDIFWSMDFSGVFEYNDAA